MSKNLLQRALTIRDEVAEAANTAHRVGQLLADMIVMLQQQGGNYLASDRPDTAQGEITLQGGAVVKDHLQVAPEAELQGGATFGAFRPGYVGGSGAQIDGHGNAEVENITIRGALRAAELLINRLTAIEGDWLMTEAGTVERVAPLSAPRTYRLHLRQRWPGDFIAFAPRDILKGIINAHAAKALGASETSTPSGTSTATSWLLVQSVDLDENAIDVRLYDDDPQQIPGGKNTAPLVGMNLARWGNQRNPERQSTLYLSSREGRIVHLAHVDSPIVADGDVQSSFGTVPDFLARALGDVLAQGRDYVFARGLIVQDIIRLGADSLPVAEVVDRGVWQSSADYYHKARNPETGIWEISDVWHEGAKWRALLTSRGVKPSTDAPFHWTLLQAAPKDGDPGRDGQDGHDGAKGEKGDKGDKGEKGAQGDKGEKGEDGKNGKDGLTTQPNMLHGTDFQRAFAPAFTAGRWHANVTSPRFEKPYKSNYNNPVFGADAYVLRSPGDSAFGDGENQYSEVVQIFAGDLIPGQQYVFSVYARSFRVSQTKFWLIAYPAGPQTSFVATQEWQRFSISFKAGSKKCNFYLRLWFNSGNKPGGSGVRFCAPKLELGAEPTPWCLSEDDKRGERGASLRPRGLWSDLKDGTRFTAGSDGDQFVDVVTVSTALGTTETYYCTQAHEKSAANAPKADSEFWRKGDTFELVATRYALVGSAKIDQAEVTQLRTAPEGHDRVVTIGAEQRTYAAGNAYPSIIQGFRQEGDQRMAVLEFRDGKTGNLLYNLGPNGIFSALNRVANKWTPAELMWVGEYCSLRQLYDWVVKGIYADNQLGLPDLERPEFAHQGERWPVSQFGHGLWFEEGYTVLNNVDDSGQARLYNVSRRGTPLFKAKRVYLIDDVSADYYIEHNFGPYDIYVTADGSAETGDIDKTLPPTGWYATRRQQVKTSTETAWHEEKRRYVTLSTLEMVCIVDGYITATHRIYFFYEDAYPLSGQTHYAQFGRDVTGSHRTSLIP